MDRMPLYRGPEPVLCHELELVFIFGSDRSACVAFRYKIINSAWTPLYIAAHGTTGAHHPFPPELVYRWNPWLFGGVAHALEWWQLSPEQCVSCRWPPFASFPQRLP